MAVLGTKIFVGMVWCLSWSFGDVVAVLLASTHVDMDSLACSQVSEVWTQVPQEVHGLLHVNGSLPQVQTLISRLMYGTYTKKKK